MHATRLRQRCGCSGRQEQALPSRHTLLYKTEYNGCAELRWTAGVLPRSANASCTLVLRQVSNLASK